jgi:DNA polymerase-3 subunit beta
LPATPFTEAVRRVSLVADRGAAVQLAFRRDVVVIEAQSAGRARAVETVPARLAGDDQVISFNPQYLLDGLTAAALTGHAGPVDPDHIGRIRLQFTSPARPALITWLPGNSAARPESAGTSAAKGSLAVPASSADDARDPAGDPVFRYLVVPLRAVAAG